MTRITLYLYISFLMVGCSSAKLVEQWTSPNVSSKEISKVLIIGITPDANSRRDFEQSLAESLKKKGIVAEKSIEIFQDSFSEAQKTETDLNKIEEQLLQAGFNAIIISKVIGFENRVTLIRSINMIERDFRNFRDDYLHSQGFYRFGDPSETSKIYHTETALYCICPGEERELVWRGSIDLFNPANRERSIHNYVQLVARSLGDSKILGNSR